MTSLTTTRNIMDRTIATQQCWTRANYKFGIIHFLSCANDSIYREKNEVKVKGKKLRGMYQFASFLNFVVDQSTDKNKTVGV